MRITNFAPYNNHTYNLFNNDKILKFENIIKLEQLKIIYEFKSNSLPKDLTLSVPAVSISQSHIYVFSPIKKKMQLWVKFLFVDSQTSLLFS